MIDRLSPSELRHEEAGARRKGVFVHIFKCAGSTVIQQARYQLGPAAVVHVNDGNGFPRKAVAAAQKTATKLICGHFSFSRISGAGALDHIQPFIFSVVREPIDRVISIYDYSRMNSGAKWHSIAAKSDPDAFFSELIVRENQMIEGHQCRFLSLDMSPTFEAARSCIEQNFDFVGRTENLAAVDEELPDWLGVQISADTVRNASASKTAIDDLGSDTRSKLEDLLAEDFKLYEYVQKTYG